MPITTHEPAPTTLLYKFRTLIEGFLMQVAQEEMLRQYPNLGVPPAPKSGWVYPLLRVLFLPGFRLTPWSLRRRLMGLFFIHRQQHWPAKPWTEKE
jgi:hypothetical protein